ncbi:hypothetical protein [Actinomadura violacea]|uniref:Uncharacterized protein n=1 Tax=Actinomadura violacea TaxID=2819934 RepID=A0ABS3RT34_9ACTN|nr:hypothetical protein [Actinomadura violacea]MBO2459801.1 hypothetical protein [Actinomadura violacea]
MVVSTRPSLAWVIAAAAATVILAVVGGVLFPAVLMRDPSRRRDARKVLRLLLNCIVELLGSQRGPEGRR